MDQAKLTPEALFQQAMEAHQEGKSAVAENLMWELLDQVPTNDGIMASLAGLLLSNGKVEEGKSLLERAILLNPENVEAQLNLGIAYQSLGRTEASFQHLSKAVSLAPERADVQFNYANFLLQTEQYKAAIETLEKVITLNSSLLQAYHTLGAVYIYVGEKAKAIQTYEAALVAVPKDLHTMILLGNAWVGQQEMAQAEKQYKELVEIYPQHFLPHLVLGKFYLEQGREIEGKAALLQAYALNPDEIETNLLLGDVSQTFKQLDDAERYYRRVLESDPQHEVATKNLRRIMTLTIPHWHFEMLADVARNDAYQKAIEKAVASQPLVLDIGTGSGLLAMMAARGGAKQVIACELHERLAATAQEIIEVNNFTEQIQIFQKDSKKLKVGAELTEKVDLIVSEILDVGAIGEGVLPSIRHAVLALAKEDVRLIPAKLKVFGQLIEIPARSRVNPITEISGFDLSPFEKYRIPDEYIKINLKAEKYRALTPVQPLWELDFYNLPPVCSEDNPQVIDLTMPIETTGEVQAMVFWFDLYLDDEIMVSSRVDGALEHWGQALFCFMNPQKLEKGETLAVKMLQTENHLRFRI
ncbi:MAG: tetratricopeptide repeat protein [Saprospiraceae bacterium]